ncbi:MAG: GNAT family N-acetyltransferase [Hyphomicrobiales bacterium]
MELDPDTLTVRDNRAANRYEIVVDDQVAELDYELVGGRIDYLHMGVPHALEGHGVASRIARFALDDARARGLRVVPLCPYMEHYLDEHPEDQDLVAPDPRMA